MTTFRNFSRHVHLWSGLTLGLLLALLGLTGSALVFYVEIDAALNPAVRTEQAGPAAGWDSPVWDQVVETARREYQDPNGDWSFEATGNPGSIPARFYPSQEHHGHHAEREMIWFSADGSQVIRSDPWGGYLMSWIYELHMHLLGAETGRLVVGWGGLATLILLISGIISWWPRGSWLNALSFKRKAVLIRRLRDLHKHAGVWSLPLLVLLVFTGGLLALPEVKQQFFSAFIVAPDVVPQPRSPSSSGATVPLTQALQAAHAALPGSRLTFIDVPGNASEPYRMRVKVSGDPHTRFPGSFIFVDQRSGDVLAVHDVDAGNLSTRISAWIRPIHDGSLAGFWTRVLAVVVGLLPTFMLVTGFLYWRNRNLRRHRRVLSNPESRSDP